MEIRIVRINDEPSKIDEAARWFHEKWGIPEEAYRDSMKRASGTGIPEWYLCLSGEKIIGGMGVIENDFHPRKDLAPNVCAVYTEEQWRGKGIAGQLLRFVCRDMKERGFDTLYLLTDHTGFYERYGWEFFCPVTGDGEENPSRMYVHIEKETCRKRK